MCSLRHLEATDKGTVRPGSDDDLVSYRGFVHWCLFRREDAKQAKGFLNANCQTKVSINLIPLFEA